MRAGSVRVGFALETNDGVANARHKLESKSLDLIVLNDALEPDAGIGVDTNRVTILGRDGSAEDVPLMLKRELADIILDRVDGAARVVSAEDLLRRYLEQRREMGETELVLDGLSVEEVMQLVGIKRGARTAPVERATTARGRVRRARLGGRAGVVGLA